LASRQYTRNIGDRLYVASDRKSSIGSGAGFLFTADVTPKRGARHATGGSTIPPSIRNRNQERA